MSEEPKTGDENQQAGEEHPPTGEEQRRAPRLECTGIGGVQKLPADEPPIPARIANLSTGGCLMELRRAEEFSIDEIVELIFNVNHLPFRVRGRVRAVRAARLIGFQFPQLSERVRRQLEDLIGELIEHLKKQHQESIARPRDEAEEADAPGSSNVRPMKPVASHPKPTPSYQDDRVHLPAQHGRWF
jgi:hypothetical protein